MLRTLKFHDVKVQLSYRYYKDNRFYYEVLLDYNKRTICGGNKFSRGMLLAARFRKDPAAQATPPRADEK